MLTIGIIGIAVIVGAILICRNSIQQQKSLPEHGTSNDYQTSEEEFRKTLLTRNHHRIRYGENSCIICGGYSSEDKGTSNPWRRDGALCEDCDRWMRREVCKEHDMIAEKDPELLLVMQTRIVRCLSIALDADDGIITDVCAKADIEAAKRFEKEERQRILNTRRVIKDEQINQRQQRESERKSASESLHRLL